MQRPLHGSAVRPSGVKRPPARVTKPGQSNGGPHSDFGRELWQVFVPLGLPVEFSTAYELAGDLPCAFVVPVVPKAA